MWRRFLRHHDVIITSCVYWDTSPLVSFMLRAWRHISGLCCTRSPNSYHMYLNVIIIVLHKPSYVLFHYCFYNIYWIYLWVLSVWFYWHLICFIQYSYLKIALRAFASRITQMCPRQPLLRLQNDRQGEKPRWAISSLNLIIYASVNWASFLIHRGRVTHKCVGKLTNIGSDNGLLPGRRQAIIWTNVGIL